MDISTKLRVIILILFLIIGSIIFGTSFLDRSCRYDPCRSDNNLCLESCRQTLVTWNQLYLDSEMKNKSIEIYENCTAQCASQLDSCRKQMGQINPLCKCLSYK